MTRGNYTRGPGSRKGRPKGSKRSEYDIPLNTRISKQASDKLKSDKLMSNIPLCALVSEAIIGHVALKPGGVTRKIKRALKNAGLKVIPGGSADQAIHKVSRVGAKLIAHGTAVKDSINDKIEKGRAFIHEQTSPTEKK